MNLSLHRLAVICFTILGMSVAANAQNHLWRPYIELEGRGTSIRTVGQGNLFVPLRQDSESLLFADFRGLYSDGDATEGNWGVGYRRILQSQWILGVNSYFDMRHSEFDNEFFQGTIGAELLHENWGFRFNGYIPDQGTKLAPGANAAFLQGNNIFVSQGFEAAYWGMDFETEGLLWCRSGCGCSCGQCGSRWNPGHLDMELWAAAGMFHFDNGTTGFENITGPRVRAELRLYDLPMLGADSRLVFSGQYEYDDVRGSVGSGMIAMRIPFGRGGGRRGYHLTGLNRRMVAPVVRDIDIVTNARALGTAEPALYADTGLPIGYVTVVDATTADVPGTVAGAGPNSTVIADGSKGQINMATSIVLQNGQTVRGAGFMVRGQDTNAQAIFGSRPLVHRRNADGNVLRIVDNATIRDMNITGGFDGIHGYNVTGFTIRGNNISNTGASGVTLSGTNNGDVVGNTVANTPGTGIWANTFQGGTISGNRCIDNYDNGLAISTLQGGTVSNNTSSGNSPSANGLSFLTISGGTVSGNTASDNSQHGFYIGSLTGGTISGNTATGNTFDGFIVPQFEGTAQLNNNRSADNGWSGYNVTVTGGTPTATNNTGQNNAGGNNTYDHP